MKKLLLVDDSALMRRVVSDIINLDNRFIIQDIAKNGLEALDLIIKNRLIYDAVILDINMPKMDGLAFLEQLQKLKITNLKVIMNSTLTKDGAKETILALERGAFDFVTKPERLSELKGEDFKSRLICILEAATGIETKIGIAEAGLEKKKQDQGIYHKESIFKPHRKFSGDKSNKHKLVAIACSTGGPKSLRAVIPLLSKDLDAPVLLVQHMPEGFTNNLANRLDELSQVKVKEAQDGDVLTKGCVYIAPGGKHLKIRKSGNRNYEIAITDEPAVVGLKPCANLMYESLIDSSFDEITCVVLTGMGADGTVGIGKLGEKNNIHVIAQDKDTSIVYGMPSSVAKANLVDEILSLDKIAQAIQKNVGVLTNGR